MSLGLMLVACKKEEVIVTPPASIPAPTPESFYVKSWVVSGNSGFLSWSNGIMNYDTTHFSYIQPTTLDTLYIDCAYQDTIESVNNTEFGVAYPIVGPCQDAGTIVRHFNIKFKTHDIIFDLIMTSTPTPYGNCGMNAYLDYTKDTLYLYKWQDLEPSLEKYY